MDNASKKFDKTTVTNHTCSVDAPISDDEKHSSNFEWQHAYGVSHGKETQRSHGPSFHESRTADINTNQTRPSQRRNSKIGYENTPRGPTMRRHSTGSCRRNEVCSSRSKSRRTSVLLTRRSLQNSARTTIWKIVPFRIPKL